MKNSKKDKKKSESAMCSPCGSSEEYPYGLRIDLSDEALDKLGLDKLPGVGDKMTLEASVKVTSVSENSYEGQDRRRSVTLQITDMKLE